MIPYIMRKVDDTSGTASVLEMATVFSEIIKEKGEPKRALGSAHGVEKKKACGDQPHMLRR